MNEPQTASELMMESQVATVQPACVLPNTDMQAFLLDVIQQTSFPGKMVEFVAHVKAQISHAKIGS